MEWNRIIIKNFNERLEESSIYRKLAPIPDDRIISTLRLDTIQIMEKVEGLLKDIFRPFDFEALVKNPPERGTLDERTLNLVFENFRKTGHEGASDNEN